MQIVDGYTFNIKTISPRVSGSWAADSFVIAGPSFEGTFPKKFDDNHIIRSSSRFTYILGRTAVFGEEDIHNVIRIQAGYKLSPLDDSTGEAGRNCATTLPIFPFVDKEELAKPSPEPQIFFTYANFIINYMTIADFEKDKVKQFQLIDVGPQMTFNGQEMEQSKYKAIQDGVADGSKKISNAPASVPLGNHANRWIAFVRPPLFGTPEALKGQYATRAFAARVGIYGNDPDEAYYPSCTFDINGDLLDSTENNYTLTFPSGKFPPVKEGGFWSVTLYRAQVGQLVHNPIDRYSIGDRTEGLVYDDKGALTLYIQRKKPTNAANWLPSPDPEYAGYKSGVFYIVCRIYWPTDEAIRGPYMPPGVLKTSPQK